jgi:hypothetical protein
VANLRLGQLLVDARMLSQQALDEVLEFQKHDGRRLGSLLVEKGLVNETQLTQILSHQLSVPWVALLHIEFSRQLLNLVPYEVAERFCLVPIYVRHVRGQGDTLYVAMDDPTNEEPLRECMKHSGLPVRAMIAPPSDIREAIRVCYGIEIAPPHSRAALTRPASQRPPPGEARAPEPPRSVSSSAPSSSGARSGDLDGPETRPPITPRVATVEQVVPSRPPVSVPEVRPAPPLSESAPSTSRSPDARPAARTSKPPPLPRPSSPGVSAPPPASASPSRAVDTEGPSVEAIEIEIPRSRRRPDASSEESGTPSQRGGPASSQSGARRMMSLTLLDGTTLSVPSRSSGPTSVRSSALAGEGAAPAEKEAAAPPQAEAPAETALTAQDVVEALRAACRGGDASASSSSLKVLGENARWEAMCAALLSLLLKKHLIQDWELIEELKKLNLP